jgi:hypothetical protein
MDPKTIAEIVAWMRLHDQTEYREHDLVLETPAEFFSSFLTHPYLDEYSPHADFAEKDDERCYYSYFNDHFGEPRCFCKAPSGKTRCFYHDHVIFSEATHAYVKKHREELDAAFAQFGAEAERAEQERVALRDNAIRSKQPALCHCPPTMSPVASLNVAATANQHLFREVLLGLMIEQAQDSSLKCIGYSPAEQPGVTLPLTEELKNYCRLVQLKYE